MLYYVFSGPLSLRAYVPEIKFNNNDHFSGKLKAQVELQGSSNFDTVSNVKIVSSYG